MNGLVLSIVGSIVLIALAVGFLALAGNFGNGRANKTRERLRAATPYVPPANSRPNDFDEWNRPW